MPLQEYNLLEIPRALDADTAYAKLKEILAGGGINIFLVKNAAEIGFNIRSNRSVKIIAAAGFMTRSTITTVYGSQSGEIPPSLHHDADYPVEQSTELEVVHHHRTASGKSVGLFIPPIDPPSLNLDKFADFTRGQFDTDVFGSPAYEEEIETGDEVLFVGNGPRFLAHRFSTLPDLSSRRVAELTFIDRRSA